MLSMLVMTFASCASSDEDEMDTNIVSTAEAEEKYEYFPEEVDFGGKEYHILNCEREQWKYIAMFTSHEYQGAAINDAFYARPVWIEETLNCKLVEVNMAMSELSGEFDKDVSSGSNTYSAYFLPAGGYYGSFMNKAIAGQLEDLDNVETIHLEEDYYVDYLVDNMSIANRHYAAASDAQLAYFEGAWVLFFDVQRLTDMQINMPYDYVKNGTWTLETLMQLATQAATPDASTGSYEFVEGGSAVYGFCGHPGISYALFYGAGGVIATKNADDFPELNVENQGFVYRAQDVGEFLTTAGVVFQCRPGDEAADPTNMITNRRAAFVGSEVFEFKDAIAAGVDFGVVPYPKYNEDQEDYMTTANYNGNYFVIPISNANPEEIGLIYDAMSWEAKKSFEKADFVDHLELKMNAGEMEEDVEMLRIIRETMNGDAASFTGTAVDLRNVIMSSINSGATTIASDIAEAKTKTQKLFKSLQTVFE